MIFALLSLAVILGAGDASAQPVQHGAQPDRPVVREGSPDADTPAAAVGELRSTSERRILGMPVTIAITLAAVVIVLLLVAGALVPRARRRTQARGGGTFGR